MADEMYAEQIEHMPAAEPSERWSEWTPEREGLARVEEALRGLSQVLAAQGGAKPRPLQPVLRPKTAAERVRIRRRQEQRRAERDHLRAGLLPGR